MGHLQWEPAAARTRAMRPLVRAVACLIFCATAILRADQETLAVQTQLKAMGYYEGEVDGQTGSQTAAAIRRFQIAQRLKVTGRLDPQTLKRLNALGAPIPRPYPTPRRAEPPRLLSPADTPKPAKPARPAAAPDSQSVLLARVFKGGPFVTLDPEMQIATVRQAQRNLKLLGYYFGPIDGTPEAVFVAALKAWQRSAGFRQTGRFDETTLKGLSLMPN